MDAIERGDNISSCFYVYPFKIWSQGLPQSMAYVASIQLLFEITQTCNIFGRQ